MIKIVCTTQKEKTELIEASQYLASLKNIDPNLKSVSWLVHLYKNPGDIEIMEDGINIQKFKSPPKFPTKSPYEPKGLKSIFDL